jgi:transketolase
MRTAFVETLCELASADSRVMLLTADLGWSVLEPFARAFPDRFINVGVAEQNLLGVAAGLAVEGRIPFVYSIANFASMRGYEQFRNGAVLHRLPVRVIGIGGGFAYGHAGPTHHGLEDLCIMRAQPGVTTLAPADRSQTRGVMRATTRLTGPAYLRIDKNFQPDLLGLDGRFAFDTPELIRAGSDLLFVTTGSLSAEVLRAADLLEDRRVSAAVAVMAHLPSSPSESLQNLLRHHPAVITAEEGFLSGGLGSLVAESIAQAGLRCQLHMQGVKELFGAGSGGLEYLRRQNGLDAQSLAALALNRIALRIAA